MSTCSCTTDVQCATGPQGGKEDALSYTTLLAALAARICRMVPTGFAFVDVVIQRCMTRFLNTENSRVVRFSLPRQRRTGQSMLRNSRHSNTARLCPTIDVRYPISSSQTDTEMVVTRGLE